MAALSRAFHPKRIRRQMPLVEFACFAVLILSNQFSHPRLYLPIGALYRAKSVGREPRSVRDDFMMLRGNNWRVRVKLHVRGLVQ